ncbi:hypothetical protein [Mucilaginibacter sp.]|uniref:hypothetical protein n=1 Tax=Mucilaginibacter sp. TaxID=1882438 RepID=UPI003AFFE306
MAETEIRPLLGQLSFIKNKKKWGFYLISGFWELSKEDFEVIKSAMKLRQSHEGGFGHSSFARVTVPICKQSKVNMAIRNKQTVYDRTTGRPQVTEINFRFYRPLRRSKWYQSAFCAGWTRTFFNLASWLS